MKTRLIKSANAYSLYKGGYALAIKTKGKDKNVRFMWRTCDEGPLDGPKDA